MSTFILQEDAGDHIGWDNKEGFDSKDAAIAYAADQLRQRPCALRIVEQNTVWESAFKQQHNPL